MKDKEKQIEEMARIIGHCYCDKECQNKCAYCDISSRNEAKKLYENGFRKFPEDSIVISREEYEILTKDIEHPTDEVLKKLIVGKNILTEQVIEKTSKETAEKILKWLKGHLSCMGFSIVKAYFQEQFGVEIKE